MKMKDPDYLVAVLRKRGKLPESDCSCQREKFEKQQKELEEERIAQALRNHEVRTKQEHWDLHGYSEDT